jgi:hypothetical protein
MSISIEELKGSFSQGQAYSEIQPQEVAWPDQQPEDLTALKTVIQDYSRAQNFMSSRHYLRQWTDIDRLWNFSLEPLMWQGTNTPRANIGIPLVLEHVESILPQVTLGFFTDSQPFEIDPRPGTQMDVARANAALLSWELKETRFQTEFGLLAKSALLYGMGIGKWGWETYKRKRKKYVRKGEPITVSAGIGTDNIHPPEYDEVEAQEIEETINRPVFKYVDLRHVLVDPHCRVPDVREAAYVIHVLNLDLEEIDRLRDNPEYKNIPSRDVLAQLAAPVKAEPAYQNPMESNAAVLGFLPDKDFTRALPREQDSTSDPLKKPFQILEYWTADRVYTVFQQKLVLRNERNVFGRIPFVSCPFINVLDAFYGIGCGRLVGNLQRLQQGVLNKALDVEDMKLSGAFVRKRGFNAPSQEIRLSPGRVIDVDDPAGFKALEFQSIFGEALAILQASDAMAQRHTAANEMAVQGQMPTKGSNLLRTATGINMLTSGTGTRLQNFVEYLADLVFVPVLEAFNEMNADNLLPSQYHQILSEELDEAYEGDPLSIKNGSYKFSIIAGAKLQAKRALAQNLPVFFQFVANDPVQQYLAVQGKKVNFEELVKMVFDVTGWPNKQSLIVQMTPEDQQRLAQQNAAMQAAALQTQKIQAEGQMKSQLISQQNEERVARDIIRDSLKHEEAGNG